MRDAACDVGPCRGPLRGNEFGNIVKRDDKAVARLTGLLGADTNRKIALMAIAVDRDLALYQPLSALPRGFHHVSELGQHVRQRMIQRLRLRVTDELFGGAVENADTAGSIDADDAGA